MTSLDQEPRPLIFGDQGEFVFDTCVESVSGDGLLVEEVTLFFHSGQNARSLTIRTGEINAIVEADQAEAIDPAIQTTSIDPHVVIKALRMPSAALLALSQEVTDSA